MLNLSPIVREMHGTCMLRSSEQMIHEKGEKNIALFRWKKIIKSSTLCIYIFGLWKLFESLR